MICPPSKKWGGMVEDRNSRLEAKGKFGTPVAYKQKDQGSAQEVASADQQII